MSAFTSQGQDPVVDLKCRPHTIMIAPAHHVINEPMNCCGF